MGEDGGSTRWYVYFICCVQWQVAGECLRILSKLLGEYEVVGEDFGEDYVEVQMGGVVPAHKSSGYIIMLHMLKDSHFLSTVSLIWCHFLSIISLTQLIVSPPVCSYWIWNFIFIFMVNNTNNVEIFNFGFLFAILKKCVCFCIIWVFQMIYSYWLTYFFLNKKYLQFLKKRLLF